MFENRNPQPNPRAELPANGVAANGFAQVGGSAGATGANGALERVFAERKDLATQPVQIPSAGLSAFTYLFTDEVVKMPRTAGEQETFAREHRILSHLHAAGLPVPKVTSVGAADAFFSQQRLAGVHLDCDNLSKGSACFDKAVTALVDFMVASQQAVTPQDAARIGIPMTTPSVARMEELMNMPEYQRLLREADEDIAGALRTYAATREGMTPVFAHADIQPANVLCSSASGEVTAVIDFGLCHYGDVAVALHAIYRHFPRDFAQSVAQKYAEATNTQPVTLENAITARLAYELEACAKKNGDAQTLGHQNRQWLSEIVIEYDNAISGYVPNQTHFARIV